MRRLVLAETVRDAGGILGNAVLVDDSTIAAVGDADTLLCDGVAEIDYAGGVLVPGLIDAHFHPVGYAAALQRPSLKAAADFTQMGDMIRQALDERPPGSPLTGLRLDDETLAEGRLPDRDVLDRIAADHPVLLIRYCGHVASANSAALRMAGVDPGSDDPRGGSFDRDCHGRPTGILRETAVDLVARAVDALTPPLGAGEIARAMTAAAALGLTAGGGVVAVGSSMWGAGGGELELLCEAAAEIPIDLGLLVAARSPSELAESARRIEEADGRLRFLGVKMFSDGSLGGHTAAMREPFSDRPDQRGTDRLDPVWAAEMARSALDLGGQVAIHAIGDAANGAVLDLMERLIGDGADAADLRIEHASVLTEADIVRIGRLGVTASVQPAFLASERDWLERRLGPDRLQRTYPFRSILAAGAPLAGGSDSPVEPLDPLSGMAAARDRCGLVPDEGLDAADALRLFTGWAGRAVGIKAGLEPGSPATFTILDCDPVACDPDGLRTARVLATWVDGEPVAIPAGITTWNE
jgi:predicted amidohydrolase YtcJ